MDTSVNEAMAAAKQLAALSPQTREGLSKLGLRGTPDGLEVGWAFNAIGKAVASNRNPVSDRDLKAIFNLTERLLKQASTANYVATDMLEAIYSAAHESGFDFSTVDKFLGGEARRYLVRWDDLQQTRLKGLTQR